MHLARSILALSVYSVSTIQAAGSGVAEASRSPPVGSFDVSLVETVKQHPRSDTLREVCRVGFRIRGCTDFPREELDCRCESREGAWVLAGRAYLEAVIHLATGQPTNEVLLHERAHIEDLERGLRRHFDSVMSISFESRSSCERYATVLSESPHLRVVMNDLRIASNIKYGCDRKGKF